MARPLNQYSIVGICAGVQFLSSIDGSMILPMGPMLVAAIHMPSAHIGYLSAAYMIAACISGLIGSLILDRFDRRKALCITMLGLAIGTGFAGVAVDVPTMIAARIVAGLFGGPATALSLAVITDNIHVNHRGWAMGIVSIGTTVAVVVGVPLGLELAVLGGWREPFFVVAILGFFIACGAYLVLPSQHEYAATTGPQSARKALSDFRAIVRRPNTLMALAGVSTMGAEAMMLSVSLAPFFVYNLYYPESKLGMLWMFGGIAGFLIAQVTGRVIDRTGPLRLLWAMTFLSAANTYLMFIHQGQMLAPVALFSVFCATNVSRFIVLGTMHSMVPPATERARFMSLRSATQQGAIAIAIFLAGKVLSTESNGRLDHIDIIAGLAIVFAFFTASISTTLRAQLLRKTTIIPETAQT